MNGKTHKGKLIIAVHNPTSCLRASKRSWRDFLGHLDFEMGSQLKDQDESFNGVGGARLFSNPLQNYNFFLQSFSAS